MNPYERTTNCQLMPAFTQNNEKEKDTMCVNKWKIKPKYAIPTSFWHCNERLGESAGNLSVNEIT